MLFDKVAIIGIGLIGSSLARVLKRNELCREVVVFDTNADYMHKAVELKIANLLHKPPRGQIWWCCLLRLGCMVR